ncbi:MAG: hypothetical protein HY664_04070, partial [Chloroflexi bacterium]|nr:hypothetical protein [Chloroflexota bacterium]
MTVLIAALATAMTEGITPEDARSMLNEAVLSAQSLNYIVNNLIELSRYQSDRLVLHMEPINIIESINSLIGKRRMDAGKHQLLLDIPEDLPAVHADRTRLELILSNLLNNAINYSVEGTEVRLSVQRQPENLLVSVSDQGIGIPADQQASLFQAFERLESAGRVTRGLGLGLLVCKRLVEAHG